MLLICSYALSLYIVQQAAAPAARMIAADAATSAFPISELFTNPEFDPYSDRQTPPRLQEPHG